MCLATAMKSIQPNAQYNVAAAASLTVRIAAHQRRKMFRRFMRDTRVTANDRVLDVGVTSDRSLEASNYLEAWYPYKNMVTASGIDDASFLCHQYPGMSFVMADALQLPFCDQAFDVIHSSAVIEHVGSFARQCAFVAECCRVARRGVFITTPNRWFPVEFHTVLPLVHWLPKKIFRALMHHTGFGFFAEERNLNLLTAPALSRAASANHDFRHEVSSVALVGWPSNLLLHMRRIDSAISPNSVRFSPGANVISVVRGRTARSER
jgi:ubiquinone/menaquinone biosynthesis C-methylase UbiE